MQINGVAENARTAKIARVLKQTVALTATICALGAIAYLAAGKWGIRRETFTFYDLACGNRPVAVEIAVRRDLEMEADLSMIRLPVAILNHGNTVKFTEYSFLANVFAVRGYMVVSIQHDIATDAPLVTKVGELYVGRLPIYQRGVANIFFAIGQLKKIKPNADYKHLTMVGHSNGGDISVYFAKTYPDKVAEVITLDNLRVPFMTDGRFKILSFRSKDPVFKADPGVVPDEDECAKAGITVFKTGYRHTDMSDRGPDDVKASIQAALDKFLTDDSVLAPVQTNAILAVTRGGGVTSVGK